MVKAALIANSLSVRGGLDGRGGTVGIGDALSGQVTQTYLDESSWSPFTSAGQYRSRSLTIANTALPVRGVRLQCLRNSSTPLQ